jgi:membrane-associated protease RseP (regulator of RpoE activity)
MTPEGFSPAAFPGQVGHASLLDAWRVRARSERLWLHALLLALTFCTTTLVGARMLENFYANRPAFDLERDMVAYVELVRTPGRVLAGLPFSLTLLTILLAHEMGHYIACLYYRLDASLPYFIPAPTFIGTFGAFIRIRSPIYSRRVLFDVGVAGPVAGFVFLLPALGIGLALSKVLPGIAEQGDLIFGSPLLIRMLEKLIFPGVAGTDIYLHPIARAAWVGLFATALNLLPFGQLDGGHILYAFVGNRFRLFSRVFLAMLLPLGYLYWPWWAWAVFLFFFGLRHPSIYDPTELGAGRRKLGWLSLAIFVVSFMPSPIATAGL